MGTGWTGSKVKRLGSAPAGGGSVESEPSDAEVVGRLDASCERPLPLLPPLAAVVELALRRPPAAATAHDEDAHRSLALGLAARVVRKPAVEERELLLEVPLDAPDALRPEVDVVAERRVAAHPDMAPRPDHESLRGRVLGRHRREVLRVRGRERVVPAGREGARDVGVLAPEARVVVLDAAPVLVVGAARVVVDQRVLERRHVPERRLAALPRCRPEQLPQVLEVVPDLGRLGRVVTYVLRVLRVDEERPEHVPLHRAALAALVLEAVRRHDVRPDGRQVRRALERRAHLRDRAVGAPDGADPPVRPRLRGDPLADVVPVPARVRRRGVVVDAGGLGAVPVAQIDQHDVVAPRDEEVRDLGVALVRLVVRRVEHDRREAALDEVPVARRPVDVEREPDAVPHRHHHVLRDDDPVVRSHAPSLSMTRFPTSSTRSAKPGWTTVVESNSSTTAGPASVAPAASA